MTKAKVTIYTKDDCPACTAAKAKLTVQGQEFTEIHIGRDITREEFLKQFPTVRSVPYIITVIEPTDIYTKQTLDVL